ncbi:hypothetical protein ACQPWW_23230 [Micromonospora sp. CA-240977]|uniref:hypothetical protein n=1 Tax=Micromonospora sp. CA-240977 TaxID=3239957 RepID=UPI003D8BBF83
MHFVGCLQSGVRGPADFDPRHVDAFINAFPDIVDAVKQLDQHSLPTPAGSKSRRVWLEQRDVGDELRVGDAGIEPATSSA